VRASGWRRKRTRKSGFILDSFRFMHGKWKHAEHYILRYENCKNNNNKDFRSYPEMTVQVVLRKFYGGIYVFDSLTLKILMSRDLPDLINNSHNNFTDLSCIETIIN
jgi:hypothetical protein